MSYLYMDLITRYLQWIVIRQRKQDLVMHSQLLQTDIRTVEAQWGKKAYEFAKDRDSAKKTRPCHALSIIANRHTHNGAKKLMKSQRIFF